MASLEVNIYIDPSGRIVSSAGGPISGTTATLSRSDSLDVPFAVVRKTVSS